MKRRVPDHRPPQAIKRIGGFEGVLAMGAILLSVIFVDSVQGERLKVSVTSSAGNSVFLDAGRAAGLEPGHRVKLFPPGGAPVDGVVRAVTSNSARVDFPPGLALPPVGTKGEVDVEEREEPAPDKTDESKKKKTPEHPPWKRKEGKRDPNAPLLAPAFSRRPEERKPTIRGRVFTQATYTQDNGEDRDNSFLDARAGLWLELKNLFGKGGRLLFDGEIEFEHSDVPGGNESDTTVHIDRLSYAIGGEDYAPWRAEAGRFYSIYLPELGLIDGAEFAMQFQNGFTLGVGGGLYPLPFPEEDWGDDYGFHVFGLYEKEEPHEEGYLSALVGYQKTWHNGANDRDQIIGRINLRPDDQWWFYGSVRADVYSGSDTIKGSGIELTELWAQAQYTPNNDCGASVSVSHYTWPELMRSEYENLPVELLTDGEVDRIDISGWFDPSDNVRVNGRANFWEDHNGDGHGGELGVDWRNPNDGPSLHLAGYYTMGAFNEGMGVRAEGRQTINGMDTYVGYEIYQYESTQLLGAEDQLRHTVRAGVSWGQGNWYHSLSGDYYFGDGEDAFTLGFYSTYRFNVK